MPSDRTAPPEVEPTEARILELYAALSGDHPGVKPRLVAKIAQELIDTRKALAAAHECDDPDHAGPHPKPDEPLICVACSIAHTAEKFAAAAERERVERGNPSGDCTCISCDYHRKERPRDAMRSEREREARELLRAWLHSYHAENGPPPLQQTSAWLAGKGDDRG